MTALPPPLQLYAEQVTQEIMRGLIAGIAKAGSIPMLSDHEAAVQATICEAVRFGIAIGLRANAPLNEAMETPPCAE